MTVGTEPVPMNGGKGQMQVEWCKVYSVLIALCLCYFGKYFCTSDMYVVQEKFTKGEGVSAEQLSALFAVGYFASMFGKVAAGAMCDAVGGRFVVLLSVVGYATATVLFSLVPPGESFSFPAFIALWACIGFFALGLAWVAIVAMATNWIPKEYLGRLMGIVSMAPQLGDATARLCLAPVLYGGWRAVFQVSATVACCVALPVLLFIGNYPPLTATWAPPRRKSIMGTQNRAEQFAKYTTRLRTLLANPFLWVLCLLSGSLYGTRTLFLLYSTTFLSSAYCRGASDMEACLEDDDTLSASAGYSSAYTLLGCVSVLLVGVMKDRLPMRHRGATLTLFVGPLFGVLAFLTCFGPDLPFQVAAATVALIGFCLFGPYKVLGAVFAVDVGGKELKSTCTAFMGVFDNMFAIFMLIAKGYLGGDWSTIFGALTALSCVSLACASYVWLVDLRAHRRASARTVADASRPFLLDVA